MRTDWRRCEGSINDCRLALKPSHIPDERSVNEKTAADKDGERLIARTGGRVAVQTPQLFFGRSRILARAGGVGSSRAAGVYPPSRALSPVGFLMQFRVPTLPSLWQSISGPKP
jgi:hypothetical protein